MSKQALKEGEKAYNKLLGANLKWFRKSQKLTQTDVARAANITFQAVQKYEKGICSPSPNSLHKIATFLNISLDDLLDPKFMERKSKETDDVKIIDYEKTTITGTALIKPKEAEEWL